MDTQQNNNLLAKFQDIFWYAGLVLFVVISVLLVAGIAQADTMSRWCVLLILVLTIGKLIMYAEQFRGSGNKTFMILSYVFMLVITVAIYFGIAIL
jgi:hypothetical protein